MSIKKIDQTGLLPDKVTTFIYCMVKIILGISFIHIIGKLFHWIPWIVSLLAPSLLFILEFRYLLECGVHQVCISNSYQGSVGGGGSLLIRCIASFLELENEQFPKKVKLQWTHCIYWTSVLIHLQEQKV